MGFPFEGKCSMDGFMSRLKTLNALFNSPLSISKSASTGLKLTLALMMEMKGFGVPELKERGFQTASQRPTVDWDGDAIDQMQILNGIAVIPVDGIMMADLPSWAKQMGYCDVMDVIEDMENATEAGVRGMAFCFDSPGGATMAGHQLFDAVQAARDAGMPLMAYAKGDMASAAFQAALPVDVIYASPYSTVGSVGTYSVIVDDDQFWANMGITFEVIASGKFKGMGITSLTTEQKNFLQDRVNSLGDGFRANVSQYRSGVAASDMQGQWFSGKESADKGFVDGLENSLQNALASFSDMIDRNKSAE